MSKNWLVVMEKISQNNNRFVLQIVLRKVRRKRYNFTLTMVIFVMIPPVKKPVSKYWRLANKLCKTVVWFNVVLFEWCTLLYTAARNSRVFAPIYITDQEVWDRAWSKNIIWYFCCCILLIEMVMKWRLNRWSRVSHTKSDAIY